MFLFISPDRRVVGIQVTEIDPHTEPGRARAEEKRIAGTDRNSVYCGWGQNNPQLVLESLVRTIRRKVKIAAQHSFEGVDEVWLLRSDAKSTHHSESSGNDAGRQRVLV